MSPDTDERARILCETAVRYAKEGRLNEAENALAKVPGALHTLKERNPWKYTNSLCYLSLARKSLGHDQKSVQKTLQKAIKSIPEIDRHFGKRKLEIQSFLKLLDSREYGHASLMLPEVEQLRPFLEEMEKGERKEMESPESWKRAAALLLASQEDSPAKAGHTIDKALELDIPCYWDRDRIIAYASVQYLKLFSESNDERLLQLSIHSLSIMADPWKQARALCQLSASLTTSNHRDEGAALIENICSLLPRIDYSDRSAMSMLLIADTIEKAESEAGSRLLKTQESLKEKAKAILDSLEAEKREASLDEYEQFISLKNLEGFADE